jgi:hypothetical protein
MANAANRGGKLGGEILQIVILTSFMTGGILALFSAFFWLYLIPSRQAALDEQVQDYNKLLDLLEPNPKKRKKEAQEIYAYRSQVREAKKGPATKNLRQLVEAELGGLPITTFPNTQDKAHGPSTKEYLQTISIKEGSLADIISFAARVKQANPSVSIGRLNLTNRSRAGTAGAGGDTDRWAADIDFFTYVTTAAGITGKTAPAAGETAAEAAPDGAAEAPSAEAPAPEAKADAKPEATPAAKAP